MAFHLFLFLLAVCLILSLALLWRLDWLHLRSASSRGGAKRTRLHRLLKPRTPVDCLACRLASPPSSAGRPAPLPVRPWPEVKSRRGAPKRIDTAGFACPNPQCPYLLAHLEWWRAYYHFVRPHHSLRVALVQPRERRGKLLAQRYRQRTPAMAAGRTHRRWTACELLSCPLPPVSA